MQLLWQIPRGGAQTHRRAGCVHLRQLHPRLQKRPRQGTAGRREEKSDQAQGSPAQADQGRVGPALHWSGRREKGVGCRSA